MMERRVTVEFGCGENPLPIRATRGKFSSGNYYVGIDLPRHLQKDMYFVAPNQGIEKGGKDIKWLLTPEEQKNIELIKATIHGRVPLRDDTADEVYIANVLTDPHFDGYSGWQYMFDEVKRILKPQGQLTIYTSYDEPEEEWLRRLLKKNSFTILGSHFTDKPEGLALIRTYERNVREGGAQHLVIATI